MHYQHRNGQEG